MSRNSILSLSMPDLTSVMYAVLRKIQNESSTEPQDRPIHRRYHPKLGRETEERTADAARSKEVVAKRGPGRAGRKAGTNPTTFKQSKNG